MKDLMQNAFFRNRWIESLIFLEKEKIVNLFYVKQLNLDPIYTCFNDFVILRQEDWFNSLNCVLILYKQHCVGFHILFRCNKVMVKKSFSKIFVRCSLYKALSEIV